MAASPTKEQFIIRVYGILINARKEVLLSDEYVLSTYMTKFPGGGMEYGEGPVECLKREAIEELGQEIEIISHFYTTDFFQQSRFHKNAQIISIYYLIKLKEALKFPITTKVFDFPKIEGSQTFRWKSLTSLTEDDVTLPIDKVVVRKLKEEWQGKGER
ncbi:NUDIX domain-containing protein [Marinilabiliaceae bacterium JC017]|nr:NUDIX domain-containing protein [Marinilabiliaceae bacterium JC017]